MNTVINSNELPRSTPTASAFLIRLGALSPWRQRLLLLVGCALLFGLRLHWGPLMEVDETRYVEATREMIASGNYLIPHFNFAPRYEKPILFYWIQCAAMRLFGQNEFAARFPSALFGVLTILMLHAFLLRVLDARRRDHAVRAAPLLGAFALATLPLFAPWTRLGITDMTLSFFITASTLALFLAAMEPRAARRWYLLAASASGLAVLTKGPVGLALPALVWLGFHWREGSLRQEAHRVPWLHGIMLLLAITLPWYLATLYVDGPGFLRHFLLTENARRLTQGVDPTQHITAREYLAGMLAFALGVVATTFPYAAFAAHDALAPFSGHTQLGADPLCRRLRRFAWVWIAATVLPVLFSATRGLNYVQGLSGAVAILFALYTLGRFTPDADRPGGAQRRALRVEGGMLALLGVGFFGFLGFIAAGGKLHTFFWSVLPAPATSRILLLLLGPVALAYFVCLIRGWRSPSRGRHFAGLLAAWAALMAIVLLGVMPLFFATQFAPTAEVGRYLRTLPRDERLLTYTRSKTSPAFPENFVYYSRRQVEFHTTVEADPQGAIRQALGQSGHLLLVTDASGLPQIQRLGKVEILQRFRYFIVTRMTKNF